MINYEIAYSYIYDDMLLFAFLFIASFFIFLLCIIFTKEIYFKIITSFISLIFSIFFLFCLFSEYINTEYNIHYLYHSSIEKIEKECLKAQKKGFYICENYLK